MNLKIKNMIRLNYNDLDGEAQQRLLRRSKTDIEKRYGTDLKEYAAENNLDYDGLLEEEAVRNLYSYTFTFSI